jgi:hypothetical protein
MIGILAKSRESRCEVKICFYYVAFVISERPAEVRTTRGREEDAGACVKKVREERAK